MVTSLNRKITFFLPEDLLKDINTFADVNYENYSQFVRKALLFYIQRLKAMEIKKQATQQEGITQ